MATKLMPDAPAPALRIETLDAGPWELAAQKPSTFTMVVFYRGLHCPVCKSYLQKLDGLAEAYAASGFKIVAVSMDSRERAQKTAQDWALSRLTIGYGLEEADARAWGLYISKAIKDTEAQVFCEPGLFWIRPDGRLYLIDVSNMPWARPDLEFLHAKIPFAVEHGYPARGGHAG